MAKTLPDLSGFTATENKYRHALMRNVTYTDGVQHLAQSVDCYWLIDKIAAMQLDLRFKEQPFQAWRLTVTGTKGSIRVTDGSDMPFYDEDITYTDFPEGEFTLWFTDDTILLPSEY